MTTRKEAIVVAAAELFAEKGFSETTTAEVAEQAGVAHGTLFYHFKTKENILLEVFESIMARYQAGMEAAVANAGSGMAAIEALLRFQLAFVEENRQEYLVVLRDFPSYLANSDSPQKAVVQRRLAGVVGVIRQALERGRQDGTIRGDLPVEETAHILRGLVYGLTRHKLLGFLALPPLGEAVVDFCRQALQPAAGA
ncbi:MAG: TetR/AcrR family transcriptional regulator [Desulfobacteraceae bacterium]|nr:TetR/AcrR family transcriptional regulator [Desulfobacteraceae bacterium]